MKSCCFVVFAFLVLAIAADDQDSKDNVKVKGTLKCGGHPAKYAQITLFANGRPLQRVEPNKNGFFTTGDQAHKLPGEKVFFSLVIKSFCTGERLYKIPIPTKQYAANEDDAKKTIFDLGEIDLSYDPGEAMRRH